MSLKNVNIDQLKAENEKLKKELDSLKLFYSELEATNQHLISATWRERDMKKQLKDAFDEINRSKEIIDLQNKRISESINYARKIQLAINATENDLKTEFDDSFILYKPKDIISGDFPWFVRCNHFVFFAAVDCTGHGVPGAMMSMIGSLLLNDIVNNNCSHTPAQILLELHEAVVKTLKQDQPDSNSNDGMDISLCRFNTLTKELVYSGAHRPLFIMKNGELEQISGDKFPIGGVQYKGKNSYTDHTFQIRKNDTILIFSDGYPDQLGGIENKKFMTKQIKDLFCENNSLTMLEIKKLFYSKFEDWKGNNKQIDDVIMLGVRF